MDTCGIYVNLDQIREMVKTLVEYSHLMIKNLASKPKVKETFEQFVLTIKTIHDSDAYNEIFRMIDLETRGIHPVNPGSIGAYFRGCLIPVNFPDNPSCSQICADSFQPPSTIEGWSSCDQMVIQSSWNSSENRFDLSSIKHGRNPGFLLVDHITLSEFVGFSSGEKRRLKEIGLLNCKLLSVSASGKEHRDLLNGFHDVDSLPSRSGNEVSAGEGVFLFLLVVFLVGVGIFALISVKEPPRSLRLR